MCVCGGTVYTSDSKSDSRKGLRVQISPDAHNTLSFTFKYHQIVGYLVFDKLVYWIV